MITGLCHYIHARAKTKLHFEPKQENSPVIPCVTFTVTRHKQIPEIQLESAQPALASHKQLIQLGMDLCAIRLVMNSSLNFS